MKIAHRVSQGMVGRLTASTAIQAVTFKGLKDKFYRDTYSHKVKDNTYLIMLPDGFDCGDEFEFIEMAMNYGVDEIMLPFDCVEWDSIRDKLEAVKQKGIKICAVISDPEWYKAAVKIGGIDNIAFDVMIERCGEGTFKHAPRGWDRLKAVHNLVKSGKFDSNKQHRLLGVLNPAEMVAYRRIFSDFIYNSISIVITSMCFVYSAYGVHLSRENGVYLQPVILPEFDDCDETAFSSEQESLYFLNKEIMDEFAGGSGGEELMRAYDVYATRQLVDFGISLRGES